MCTVGGEERELERCSNKGRRCTGKLGWHKLAVHRQWSNNVGKTDIKQVHVQIPAIAFGTGSRWYEKVREWGYDTPSFTLDLTMRTGCTGLCRTGDRERVFSH